MKWYNICMKKKVSMNHYPYDYDIYSDMWNLNIGI